MSPAHETIFGMLATIRRTWLRRELVHGGLLGLEAVSAWLFGMIVLDNLAMLSAGQFVLAWVVLVTIALAGLLVLLYRLLHRPSLAALALMYEARLPQRYNRLINSLQFLQTRQAQRDPLACAAVLENSAALEPHTAAQAIDLRPLRRALLVLGGCAAVLMGYYLLRPQWAGNALARLFHPLAPEVHLLATEPRVTPGNVELLEGTALEITARVPVPRLGRTAQAASLEYRVAELDWVAAAMDRQPDGRFRCGFQAVRYPLDYRVRAGHSLSPSYHVSLRLRPRLEQLQVHVQPPAYAGSELRALRPNVGDVTALTGATIALELTASAALSSAQLELTPGETVPLQVLGQEGRQARGSFTLQHSGSYAIQLTDLGGLTNLRPPRYTLLAEPDQPPLAIVSVPGRDLILSANAVVELTLEAEDDIGLARLMLQTRQGSAAWQTQQEWVLSEARSRRCTQHHSLDLAAFDVQVNDVLLYRLVAWDSRPARPNVGIGRTWSLTVAPPDDSAGLLTAETRRLSETLQRILALQRENRTAVDLDQALEPVRAHQQEIRDLTLELIDEQHRALRPADSIIRELRSLADGPMLAVIQSLVDYGGTYAQRWPKKQPILELMDEIITRLVALLGKVDRALGSAEQAQVALEKQPPEHREQALQRIHDLLAKLNEFLPEQERVIVDTEELVRKGADLTAGDLEKIERLKGTEDKWAEILTDSVQDVSKLTEQGFADTTIANDYKEMVEQIEAASLNLTPGLIELAVPREQAGRELAESLVEEMEMWLPNSPDHVKWMMEEPLDFPEIPMVELPDQLWDFIGDLIEEQDELNEAAEDVTSAWADSLAEGAGWEVAGGPISNFSAVGKTGNQLPDNNELSGRSGDGRAGRSQGQLVENVAKGLRGRTTPTRVTNDPYEQGVVKELQQMATGGATGGGKARGAGQEGLQGQSPPPLLEDMQFMTDWQQRIRQKAERVAGQLERIRLSLPRLDEAIALMSQAEQAAVDGRYAEMFAIQQMVLQNLRMSGELALRDLALQVDRAYYLPAEQRRRIFDAFDEPVPREYQEAVQRYFEQLSASE